MSVYMIKDGELYHHGVKGMKWGVRRYGARLARGHAGPGIYFGSKKRRLKKYKEDLAYMDKGGHLSIGATKSRQAAFDKRDRDLLNKKIDIIEKGKRRRTIRLEQAVKKQQKIYDSWKDNSPIKDKNGTTILSKKDCKDVADRAKKRLEKLEYKLAIQQRADQINKGASAIGRAYNKITGADRIQAETEFDMKKERKSIKLGEIKSRTGG